MLESGHGIPYVLNGIRGVEGVEYFLEKADAGVYPGVYSRFDVRRGETAAGVESRERAPEVDPVDRPWIILVGSVFMDNLSRKNEILALPHGISSPADHIPALAVDAVYEHVFPYRRFPFAVMVPGFGIISYIRDEYGRCHRVVFDKPYHCLWENDAALSFKAVFPFHGSRLKQAAGPLFRNECFVCLQNYE